MTTAMKRPLRQQIQRAKRGIWHAATENGAANRWVTALSLTVLWFITWWALGWWVFPLDMPQLVRFGIGMSVELPIFWFLGPLGYGIRYLLADFRIWRRNRRGVR